MRDGDQLTTGDKCITVFFHSQLRRCVHLAYVWLLRIVRCAFPIVMFLSAEFQRPCTLQRTK